MKEALVTHLNRSKFFIRSGSVNTYDKEVKELENKPKRVEMILKNQATTENVTMLLEKELVSLDVELQVVQGQKEVMQE